jgi:hypothetical protein
MSYKPPKVAPQKNEFQSTPLRTPAQAKAEATRRRARANAIKAQNARAS